MKTEQIKEKYIEFVLENGTQPPSIFAFCKKLKIKEKDFYEHFSSFIMLENAIWLSFFEKTISIIENDAAYPEYSVREKVLAFYYTLIEVLKENRSYVLKNFEHLPQPIWKNMQAFTELRIAYQQWIQRLMMEGSENKEVENRPYINQHYPKVFWGQMLYLIDFWVKDTSKGFEKTDTAIEKIVNTSFDLLGKSPLDSMLDLGKFLFQNR